MDFLRVLNGLSLHGHYRPDEPRIKMAHGFGEFRGGLENVLNLFPT